MDTWRKNKTENFQDILHWACIPCSLPRTIYRRLYLAFGFPFLPPSRIKSLLPLFCPGAVITIAGNLLSCTGRPPPRTLSYCSVLQNTSIPQGRAGKAASCLLASHLGSTKRESPSHYVHRTLRILQVMWSADSVSNVGTAGHLLLIYQSATIGRLSFRLPRRSWYWLFRLWLQSFWFPNGQGMI